MSNVLEAEENLKFIETFAFSIDENESNLFGLLNTAGSRSNGSSSSSSASSSSRSSSSSSSSSRSCESNVQNKLDGDRSSITGTHNEDIMDSVQLLRAVVQSKLSSSESSSSELRIYMSTLDQIEQSLQISSTSSSSLTEADLFNINQSLRNIESQLNTTITGEYNNDITLCFCVPYVINACKVIYRCDT